MGWITTYRDKLSGSRVETFISPAGFLEQKYIGPQTGPSVKNGVKKLDVQSKKIISQNKDVLMLINLDDVTTTNRAAHLEAVKAMRYLQYKKTAIYGPVRLQVLLNTLTLVAGMQKKIRVFSNRIEAIKWLREKT
jgi:hypothetical protein